MLNKTGRGTSGTRPVLFPVKKDSSGLLYVKSD